ncbi:hypothetical protein [Streptomyces sp. A1-5]|uniref:hypothetical protein n=1 Tax=Streptomyces sp. A1-5 TaxID=2738410 RepID=UPI001F25984D|nr:hypothetical protein [Streptomyces sp. A1-5]UJB44823.1 hypothetical protein HRD51_32130 [Streptomyces sp. A1-5]
MVLHVRVPPEELVLVVVLLPVMTGGGPALMEPDPMVVNEPLSELAAPLPEQVPLPVRLPLGKTVKVPEHEAVPTPGTVITPVAREHVTLPSRFWVHGPGRAVAFAGAAEACGARPIAAAKTLIIRAARGVLECRS